MCANYTVKHGQVFGFEEDLRGLHVLGVRAAHERRGLQARRHSVKVEMRAGEGAGDGSALSMPKVLPRRAIPAPRAVDFPIPLC
jgi:hypothetical protein